MGMPQSLMHDIPSPDLIPFTKPIPWRGNFRRTPMPNNLAVFEGHKIRRSYDEKAEKWYFSVVDVIQALTQQADFQTARKYWNKFKERLGKEGSQLVTNCHRFK